MGFIANVIRCTLVSALFLIPGGKARADVVIKSHDLKIRLEPGSKKLIARDDLVLSPWQGEELSLLLSPKSRIKAVTVGQSEARYSFDSGRLSIFSKPPEVKGPVRLSVSYEAVFDDKVNEEPVSFDNPGFGVRGIIGEQGTFLLSDSGWYPRSSPEGFPVFHIEVAAPRGIYAVTAGRLIKKEDRENESISVWEIKTPVEGLALSAGPYIVRSRLYKDIPIYTFFFPKTDSLSERYLDASASHIEFYEKLIGPYPFPKFAVVENFFPTGYGFPSYTLLGTSVLALPFIPETSLKHEVAHSWWGNSVFVDYKTGNWCEGLTTYVADYHSQELISPTDARTYRLQILQDYATLVHQGGDFPLDQFKSRTSPASRAVGYGKAAFVFHMVRQRLGDELFWKSLRRLYKERVFKETSWSDIRDIFVKEGGWNADEAGQFFDQWLKRPGAPVLELRDVRSSRSANKWSIKGTLAQTSPLYALDPTLRLEAPNEELDKPAKLKELSTAFDLKTDWTPRKLIVDPEFNLFRLLYPSEIPATVNSIKGSRKLAAVFSASMPKEYLGIFKLLLESLNHPDSAILSEAQAGSKEYDQFDFLFFGLPRSQNLKPLVSAHPEGLELTPESFSLGGVFSSADSDCLFAVIKKPGETERCVALFLPVSGTKEEAVLAAARKITHYGKYSYLSFSNGTNRAKGFWPVSASPLALELKDIP